MAAAALDAALASDQPVTYLQALQPELARILTNISCRLPQRDPALRPQRDALAALISRLKLILKAMGGGDTAPRQRAVAGPTNDDCPLMGMHGPRHLCGNGCYLAAYAGARCALDNRKRARSSEDARQRSERMEGDESRKG